MHRSSLFFTAAILILLSGCETNKGPINPDFRNSVRHNMSVHIINPRIPKPGTQAPDLEGARAVLGIDRYQRGDVKKLQAETTSKKGGAAGSKE